MICRMRSAGISTKGSTVSEETAGTTAARGEWRQAQSACLAIGLAGLATCLAGAWLRPSQFFRAYLAAYNFWLSIALGCLVILMMQYLTGGVWGVLSRRVFEAGTR